MEVKNCKKCRDIFWGHGDLCIKCKEKEFNEIKTINSCIDKNPQYGIDAVSKNTSINKKIIIEYLKEKKIHPSAGLGNNLKCEKCGNPIGEGIYCSKCQNDIMKVLSGKLDAKSKLIGSENESGYYSILKRH